MSRNGIDIAEWMLRATAKADSEGCCDKSSWAAIWEETYRELGGQSASVGQKGCPKNAAYGLWFLGRIKNTSRTWQGSSVSEVNRELGKNASYAVIAVDVLAEKANYKVEDLWERVKRIYSSSTGEAPANSEQGQIRLVLALAERAALACGNGVAAENRTA